MPVRGGLVSMPVRRTKNRLSPRREARLGLTIVLLLGVMVQDVKCCEMIQFPPVPEEEKKVNNHLLTGHDNKNKKNQSSSYVNIGSYGMPMMKDTWYQIRPCKQGIGGSSPSPPPTAGSGSNSHNNNNNNLNSHRNCDRCVRLESYHYPDHFLRQTPQGNIRLHPFPYAQRDHDTFHLDSSFCMTTTTTTTRHHHPEKDYSWDRHDHNMPAYHDDSGGGGGGGGTRGGKNKRKRISLESVKHPGLYLSAVTMTKDQDDDHHHQSSATSVVVDVGVGGFGMGGGDLRLSGGLKLVGIEDPVTTPLWQQDQQIPDLALTFPCKGYYGLRQKELMEEEEDHVHRNN